MFRAIWNWLGSFFGELARNEYEDCSRNESETQVAEAEIGFSAELRRMTQQLEESRNVNIELGMIVGALSDRLISASRLIDQIHQSQKHASDLCELSMAEIVGEKKLGVDGWQFDGTPEDATKRSAELLGSLNIYIADLSGLASAEEDGAAEEGKTESDDGRDGDHRRGPEDDRPVSDSTEPFLTRYGHDPLEHKAAQIDELNRLAKVCKGCVYREGSIN